MIAAAGFKWVRMDLTWAATERVRGEYDSSAYDRLVGARRKTACARSSFSIKAIRSTPTQTTSILSPVVPERPQWDTIFLLDNVSREPVEGEIYLSAPTLIY